MDAGGYLGRDERGCDHVGGSRATVDERRPAGVKRSAQHHHAWLAHPDRRTDLALIQIVGLGDHVPGMSLPGLRRCRLIGPAGPAERDLEVVTVLCKPGVQQRDASRADVRPVGCEGADDPADVNVTARANGP